MPLLRTMARTTVIAGTANAVTHRQQQRWAQNEAQQAAQQAPAAPPAPAPAAPAADDPIAKLRELAELHSQGILTDEEFAAAKAKLL